MDLSNKKKNAFTMAEVLVTLGIVGVVAAMVMPSLATNIQQRMLESKVKTSARTLLGAIENMTNADKMGYYANTEEFVNALSNHLKIAQTCGSNNLSDCWNYNTISVNNKGDTFNITSATNGENTFHMNWKDPFGRVADYTSNNVSFMTMDGTAVLISYNKQCHTDGTEPRTCFAAVFDANGKKLPNRVGQDVFLINTKKLGNYIGSEQLDLAVEGHKFAKHNGSLGMAETSGIGAGNIIIAGGDNTGSGTGSGNPDTNLPSHGEVSGTNGNPVEPESNNNPSTSGGSSGSGFFYGSHSGGVHSSIGQSGDNNSNPDDNTNGGSPDGDNKYGWGSGTGSAWGRFGETEVAGNCTSPDQPLTNPTSEPFHDPNGIDDSNIGN